MKMVLYVFPLLDFDLWDVETRLLLCSCPYVTPEAVSLLDWEGQVFVADAGLPVFHAVSLAGGQEDLERSL